MDDHCPECAPRPPTPGTPAPTGERCPVRDTADDLIQAWDDALTSTLRWLVERSRLYPSILRRIQQDRGATLVDLFDPPPLPGAPATTVLSEVLTGRELARMPRADLEEAVRANPVATTSAQAFRRAMMALLPDVDPGAYSPVHGRDKLRIEEEIIANSEVPEPDPDVLRWVTAYLCAHPVARLGSVTIRTGIPTPDLDPARSLVLWEGHLRRTFHAED